LLRVLFTNLKWAAGFVIASAGGRYTSSLGAVMLARRGPPDHDDSSPPGKRQQRPAPATFQQNELSPEPSDVSARGLATSERLLSRV
jgi:hypothetical protein